MDMELCKSEYRLALAMVLRYEPSAREMFRVLRRLGAKNIRPDYMLVRNEQGTYDRLPDLKAWNANCRGGLAVSMLRHGENDWSLHS